jgi:molecular chaperone Hsp33
MKRKDYLLRGTACHDQFRFFVADTTGVVQTALELHQMAPAPTLLLGRLLTAALLMGADIKDEAASLTLNVEAKGPLKGAIAIYESGGNVRGYAKNPSFFDENIKNNWQIGKLLGKGNLNIIKDMRLKAPETGTIALVTGEIGEDIAHYYLQSEQIPTAVSLGVLFNKEGTISAAGGYIMQQLPSASAADVEKLKANLDNTPYITDLLDMGLDWEGILSKMLFKDMDVSIHDTLAVRYHCSCSKERFANALRLLGRKELETMTAGISPVCHYCNKQYDFSADDMQQILKSLDK